MGSSAGKLKNKTTKISGILFSIQEKANFPSNKLSQITWIHLAGLLETVFINSLQNGGEWIQSQPGSKSPRKS